MRDWRVLSGIIAAALLTGAGNPLSAADDAKQAAPQKADTVKSAPKTAPKDTASAKSAQPTAKDKKAAAESKPGQPSAQPQYDWSFLPDPVAVIGDQKITKAEFIKDAEEIISRMPYKPDNAGQDGLKKISRAIATTMVDRIAMSKLAAESGMKPSPELAEAELVKMEEKMPAEQKDMLAKELKTKNMSMEEHRKKLAADPNIQKDIIMDKWIRENIVDKLKIEDKDAKDYYDKNLESFKTPDSLRASHILIKPENDTPAAKEKAKKKAADILAKIQKGKMTFEAAAEKESACPSGKDAKGDLGDIPKGYMPKEFEDAAAALEPGKTSGVVESPMGFHIIKLSAKKQGSQLPFDDEIKGYIKRQMTAQKVRAELKSALQKEKDKLGAKIFIPEN